MYNGISFCEFLEQSEYLFNGFVSVGGKRNEDTGKIFLKDAPALRKYKDKYHNALETKGKCPHLTDATKKIFLDKCRYFIYPEKRDMEYKLKSGETVESLEIFSSKCVTLFFQLTGIDFSFLRIDTTYKKKAFVKAQQECLENLFCSIVDMFMRSDAEIRMVTLTDSSLDSKEVSGFKIKDTIDNHLFMKCVKVLFLHYRYKLYRIDPEHLIAFSPILPHENVMLFKYNMEACKQFSKIIHEWDKEYNLYSDEVDLDSRFDLTKTLSLLENIKSNLKQIQSSDGLGDVEIILSKQFKQKQWCLKNGTVNVKKFKEKPPKDWKDKCIQIMILYNTSWEIPKRDTFDEFKFIASILYHSANRSRVECEGIKKCGFKLECGAKKSCKIIYQANKIIHSLRNVLWEYIGTKSADEVPDEVVDFVETIERICLFYF